MGTQLTVRTGTPADSTWIHELRHRVYADELGQHPTNDQGRLVDALDQLNTYLVVADGDEPLGFVSVTPPWAGSFGLDKYLSRAEMPLLDEPGVFEVRLLTVRADHRGSGVATLLMYAALRWVAGRGGRTVVAMGRSDVLDLYRSVGLTTTGRSIRSGAVEFEVMTASVAAANALALGPFAAVVDGWRRTVDWRLDVAFSTRADGCEHGGASFGAIGTDFRDLGRRSGIVAADVLDAWFDPAPEALAVLAEDPGWLARTSPPSDAEGLVAEIAASRGLPTGSIAVGSGSSDLIFRAFLCWLDPTSRVLLVDPGYGEYAHVTERVVGCHVERFNLRRDEGWRIDADRLAASVAGGRYDLVVVVNPNNPTGRHTPAAELRAAIAQSPAGTRWWIDEAYLGYVGFSESLAPLAAEDPRVAVSTSLSKMYALSGVRAAYLVAEPASAERLRMLTPPWQVSLPAQIAAVAALRDPEHYHAAWDRTHVLRGGLARDLVALGVDVEDTVVNFLNLVLPTGAMSAPEFVAACRGRGVYLRDLSPLSPSYEGRTVRVAVRGEEENARIVSACADVLEA